jgi:hypothetical protein
MTAQTNNAGFAEGAIDGLQSEQTEINIEYETGSSGIKARAVIIEIHYGAVSECIIIEGAQFNIKGVILNAISGIADDPHIISEGVKILSSKFTLRIKIKLKVETYSIVSDRDIRHKVEGIEGLTVDPI